MIDNCIPEGTVVYKHQVKRTAHFETAYTKKRILHYSKLNLSSEYIFKAMADEGILVSKSEICKFLKDKGTILRKEGLGQLPVIDMKGVGFINEAMHGDDETTTRELKKVLDTHGRAASESAVLRCRKPLGWTYRRSAYCQLIRDSNKEKRLAWAILNQDQSFSNAIFTDETSVQLESHRQFSYRKVRQVSHPNPQYA